MATRIRAVAVTRPKSAAVTLGIALAVLAASTALAVPMIAITAIPPYKSSGRLEGTVSGVEFATHQVAVYIYVDGLGWYSKPTFANPTIQINSDGTFDIDLGAAVLDNRATIYCAALLPGTGCLTPGCCPATCSSQVCQDPCCTLDCPPRTSGGSRVPAELQPLAIVCNDRYDATLPVALLPRTLQFAGHTWAVKETPASATVGPGWMPFSDLSDDVFVDSAGLHLTSHFHDGVWWATEVVLLERLGRGTYLVQTASRLDDLDPNATFGAFTWDPYGDEDLASANREIDIEDSRWCNAQDPTNAQFVVQPFGVPGNLDRYTLSDLSLDSRLTRFFTWRPTQIEFFTLRGYEPSAGFPPENEIHRFFYTEDANVNRFIPTGGRAAFRLNLWLNNVEVHCPAFPPPPRPARGLPVEVIATDFQFHPAPACGDVNDDGAVNIGDALLAAQFDVRLRHCGEAPFTHPEVCDVNGDGACNIGDALRMAQCDVGLTSCAFTCQPSSCS